MGNFNTGFTWVNLIDLKTPGDYEISFYTYLYCPKPNCDTDDTISLKVKNENDVFREIYRSGVPQGRVRDNQWVKDSVLFTASTSKINVSSLSLLLNTILTLIRFIHLLYRFGLNLSELI